MKRYSWAQIMGLGFTPPQYLTTFPKKKTHTHYIIYFTLHFKNVILLSSFLLFYLSHNKNIKK